MPVTVAQQVPSGVELSGMIIPDNKPLPTHMLPNDVLYSLCFFYVDIRYSGSEYGKYQALLYLVIDQNHQRRVYFINTKGYGSDIHGSWDELPNGDFVVHFHCMGSRGIAMYGAQNVEFKCVGIEDVPGICHMQFKVFEACDEAHKAFVKAKLPQCV